MKPAYLSSCDFLQIGNSYFYVSQALHFPKYFGIYLNSSAINQQTGYNESFSRMIFTDEFVQKCCQQGIPLFSSAFLSRSPLLLPLPPSLFDHHSISFKLLH
ncbi:hypothetical protein HAX54_048536 [Datura stramonium]|uniref:Uncharacterized protein n=1 Tax=Datura stramonium TaxID=4076 RepID=A0ABS8STZ6_DATST|nr:hypothetical protein [Datura stramonium]